MRTFCLAAFAVPLVFSTSALAADWYVDASATAGGSGASTAPFQTIGAAVAVLSRGDTVWIATGTYPEVVNIGTLSGTGTTTLRAMAGATPVIDGTSGSEAAGFVVQTATADTTFQGLTVANGIGGALGIQFYYADGGQVLDCTTQGMTSNAVTFYYSSQGMVSGCTLQGNIAGRKTTGTVATNNEVYGASAEGIGFYDGSTNCTISHNVVHDNFSVNIYMDSISHSLVDGNLVYESDASNDLEGIELSDEYYTDLPAPVNSYNTITNNVLVANNLGIVFWMSGEWPSSALQNQSGLRYDVISNNTIVGSMGALKWDDSPAHVGTTIENNIFAEAAGTSPLYLLQANSAGGITLDHDLWFSPDVTQPFLWTGNAYDHAGWVTASGQGGGDVLSDPLFSIGESWTAPPATNLELTGTSPAIDAGVTLSAVPEDYLGNVRPAGHFDLGAFQYGASPPPDGGLPPPPPGADGGESDSGHGASGQGDSGQGASGQGDSGGVARTDAGRGSSIDAGGGVSSAKSGGGASSLDGGGGSSASGSSSSGGCSTSGTGSAPERAFWMLAVAGGVVLRRRRRSA